MSLNGTLYQVTAVRFNVKATLLSQFMQSLSLRNKGFNR
jgi:hypothetical protein